MSVPELKIKNKQEIELKESDKKNELFNDKQNKNRFFL